MDKFLEECLIYFLVQLLENFLMELPQESLIQESVWFDRKFILTLGGNSEITLKKIGGILRIISRGILRSFYRWISGELLSDFSDPCRNYLKNTWYNTWKHSWSDSRSNPWILIGISRDSMDKLLEESF